MKRLRLLIFHLSLALWLGSTGFLFLSAGSVFESVAPYKAQHPELAAKVVGGIFDSYFWVLVVTLSVVLFGAFKFFVPYF